MAKPPVRKVKRLFESIKIKSLQKSKVFRRADKNDDGSLSWEEFRSFFADGVLSEEELKELFIKIDTNKTDNIDTSELCTYFGQHLGAFKEIFAAVEEINVSISKALQTSAKDYSSLSRFDKFASRFLLREMVSQISALQRPLEVASDHLDDEAQKECRENHKPTLGGVQKSEGITIEVSEEGPNAYSPGTIIPGRVARRAKRQASNQSLTDSFGYQSGSLEQQLQRLQLLVDRLENKVTFDPVEEEEVTYGQEELHVIVHRKFVSSANGDKAFRNSLRSYIEGTGKEQGCLHLNIRTYPGSNLYTLYEIWDSEGDWKRQYKSEQNKKFQHSNVDNLEIPEQQKVMHVPNTWWKKE